MNSETIRVDNSRLEPWNRVGDTIRLRLPMGYQDYLLIGIEDNEAILREVQTSNFGQPVDNK